MSEPYASATEHERAAVGWVLHTLDPDDEVTFLLHLDACDRCGRAVAELSAATSAVGAAVPAQEPPARLRESIMAAVAVEPDPPRRPVAPETSRNGTGPVRRQTADAVPGAGAGAAPGGDADATVVPLRRRASRVRGVALVAAVAVLVAAVGGLVAVNRSVTAQRDQQAAQAERVSTLLQDAGRPGALHATLADPGGAMVGMVVDVGSGARVLTTGLGDNRADETYVLWSLAGATPRPVGTFDVSGSTPSVRSVGSAAEAGRVAGFAVSLEPGRVAPASPTRIVASGQVGR